MTPPPPPPPKKKEREREREIRKFDSHKGSSLYQMLLSSISPLLL